MGLVLTPLVVGVAMSASASAGKIDAPEAGKENWDGNIEFSASTSTGNTDNAVIGSRFEAKRVLGRYTHVVKAAADYAETTKEIDGEEVTEETQNKWFAQYRLEVQTADRTFVYGRTRYEQDVFSGYDQRAFLGGGFGHTIAGKDALEWNLLAGPGVQYTQFVKPEVPEEDFERDHTQVALYLGSDVKWTIRENVQFEHDADATWTDENSTFATRAALTTKLTDTISTRLSYLVKHETEPAENREATDTQLKASVVFGF